MLLLLLQSCPLSFCAVLAPLPRVSLRLVLTGRPVRGRHGNQIIRALMQTSFPHTLHTSLLHARNKQPAGWATVTCGLLQRRIASHRIGLQCTGAHHLISSCENINDIRSYGTIYDLGASLRAFCIAHPILIRRESSIRRGNCNISLSLSLHHSNSNGGSHRWQR